MRGGRLLKASCFGKGPTAGFLYDLVEGTDEGVVSVLLTVGTIRHCTAFDDAKGRDGSDGKTFLGRDAPPPAACGVPPVLQ